MSTSSNGGKVVVAAMVLALLALMCSPVRGSRFVKFSASAHANLNVLPPAPVVHWQHSPPPPDYVQFPPPVHHYIRHPRSAPPPSNMNVSSPLPSTSPLAPSPSPPLAVRPPRSRSRQFPPPVSPAPSPEEDRKHSQNGRRLFVSDHVADPHSWSDQGQSGRNEFLKKTDASRGKCSDPVTGVPYGGHVPVGAPVGDPGVPSPEPAPSPTSGAEGPFNNQPAPPPQSGDNNTMAHTTMVSAMQYNQCTYTIITSTGNIEGASTTADVNVEFFDKFGNSVLFVNLRSQNRNFNRGATDTFTVVGDCVQNICRMHLSHDDSGPNPGWFVNTVTVSLLYQTHVFNVFEWLAKDEPPYSLSRIISSCPA